MKIVFLEKQQLKKSFLSENISKVFIEVTVKFTMKFRSIF